MANEILGAKKYLTIVDEVTWGTFPGSPTYIHVPVTDYSVRMHTDNRQAATFIGLMQRKHSQNFRGMPTGQLQVPLYGWIPSGLSISLAEYFLTWAFGQHETVATASKAVEWAEGPDVANKRHTGLRVNSATLTGSADNDEIHLSLDLMGKDEAGQDTVTSAQSLPADRNKLVEFSYAAPSAFSINSVSVGLKSFQIQAQYGLQVEYLGQNRPTLIVKKQRIVTVQLVPVKNADTYDAMRRAVTMEEFPVQLVLKGLHNGTGSGGTNWTKATIDLPRCSFIDKDDQGGKDDLVMEQLNLIALKPDSSDNDMSITMSEAA